MQEELFIGEPIKFGKPSFCESPEAFNAIDVAFSSCELVLGVVDTVVVIAIEDEAIIGFPAICMDGASF